MSTHNSTTKDINKTLVAVAQRYHGATGKNVRLFLGECAIYLLSICNKTKPFTRQLLAKAAWSECRDRGTETEEDEEVEEDGAATEGSEVDVGMKNDASVLVDSKDDEENEAVSETRYLPPKKEYPSL